MVGGGCFSRVPMLGSLYYGRSKFGTGSSSTADRDSVRRVPSLALKKFVLRRADRWAPVGCWMFTRFLLGESGA